MSYNQSFAPQAGQGNLSAQFGGGGQYRPAPGASAPRDIPGRPRRQSSVSGGYPQQNGGYGTSPGMAYSPNNQAYGTSPQHLGPPPQQATQYGSPSGQPYGQYSTSPQYQQPMATSHPGAGWQPGWQQPRPQYGPSSYPPPSSYHPGMDERRKSSVSSHSHHSGDYSDKPKTSRRKSSAPTRYDSPRRPTMTDSLMAAWGGLKGAFDARK